MKHVLHLIKGLGRGGAEMLLPQTVRAGGGGFRYSAGYFLPWKDALVAELGDAGAPVHRFTARNNLAVLAQTPFVARHLRRERIDLVHAHLPLSGVVARLAGRLAGVPVVYTEHNLQERYHRATRRMNLLTWRLQRGVIAVSQEVADSARRHAGDRVPVMVVRNGIDVAAYQAAAAAREATRRELGLADGTLLIGTVAVFRAQKRLDLWLEAAELVAREVPPVRFVVVGDGPLAAMARSKATELGIMDRVMFPGLQESVAPYLAAMDVYLISSEFEGLPLALLEAMAAGLPVVSTAVGGIPEVIEDDTSGLLAPFGSARALAERVVRLAADPGLRERLGQAGRRRVESEFGVARMAAEVETIYRDTLR